jgi:hypothetical protein
MELVMRFSMEFPFTQQQWKEILTRLYKRAAVDHQFHVLCTRDSHAAIKLICGYEIPRSVGVRFEPQHSDEIILVLPKENKDLFNELSDHDLEEIAEGMARICIPFTHALESQPQPRAHK